MERRARLAGVPAVPGPHGFKVSEAGPGRTIIVTAPGGFDEFVAVLGEPAADLRLPEPVPPTSRSPPLLTASRSSPHPGRSRQDS
jgi:hypothetical protein